MNVELLKDWADYKKGDQVDIEDQAVLDAGYKIGLFKKEKFKKDLDDTDNK